MSDLPRRMPDAETDRCGACHRTGTNLETVTLAGFGIVRMCLDPTDCRKHWKVEPQ